MAAKKAKKTGAKRKPNAGRLVPSGAMRTFVPMTMSSTSEVVAPSAVTTWDSGATRRLVIVKRSYNPPSTWISAIELTPMLKPISGARSS